MSKDSQLIRWSNLLAALAIFAAFINIAAVIYPLTFNEPLAVVKNSGAQIWTTTANDLPVFERLTVLSVNSLTNFIWLYALVQFVWLARNYGAGRIFGEANARCFVRIGVALGLMGIVLSLRQPFINHFLYWRGISPWLGDMPPLFLIQPDYLMAGVFFFILGKIMRVASELEESDRQMI